MGNAVYIGLLYYVTTIGFRFLSGRLSH